MAEKDEKKTDNNVEEGEAPAKSKKKLFIILGIALGVLGGGGGAAFFFLSGGQHAAKSEDSSEHGAGEQNEHGAEASSGHGDQGSSHGAEEGHGGGHDKEGSGHGDAPKEGAHGASEKGHDGQGAHGETKHQEEASDQTGVGETYTFKTFHLNLGNPLENHYIRLEVAIEYDGGEEQKKEILRREAQLRDAIVSVTSRKTREFLLSPHGKDQLRREIFIRINRYMTKPIKAVYITDILIE